MNLLIVGTIAFDTVETPRGRVDRAIGGSGTYASLAAGFFTKPRLVGVIGDDFPEEYLELLRARGVDTRGVKREKGRSFFWHGRYAQDVNVRETLVTELNVLETFHPELSAEYSDSGFVFLANIDPVLQLEVLDAAPNAVFTMADTMNFWIDSAPEALEKVIGRVNALMINESEARQLGGSDNLIRAARDIQKRGPHTVIVKKGEYGVMMLCGDEMVSLPAYPLDDVFDPTGAGDSFAGGFMGCITAAGTADPEALRLALFAGTAAASICCEDFSVNKIKNAQPGDIRARAQILVEMTRADMAAFPL